MGQIWGQRFTIVSVWNIELHAKSLKDAGTAGNRPSPTLFTESSQRKTTRMMCVRHSTWKKTYAPSFKFHQSRKFRSIPFSVRKQWAALKRSSPRHLTLPLLHPPLQSLAHVVAQCLTKKCDKYIYSVGMYEEGLMLLHQPKKFHQVVSHGTKQVKLAHGKTEVRFYIIFENIKNVE